MQEAAVYVHPSELVPWKRNPRDNDAAVEDVARSIERFSFGAPIVARLEDRTVIAGHTRLKAAEKLGLEKVPVRFLDISAEEAEALALADNKLSEMASWTDEVDDILRELNADSIDITGLGWSQEELDDIIAANEPEIFDDAEIEPLPEIPDSIIGGVYELGPHRLVCGDSTDEAIWLKLLPGESVHAIWTDPPYGVAFDQFWTEHDKIENDNLSDDDLEALLHASMGLASKHARPGSAFYVAAPPGPPFHIFGKVLRSLDVWRNTLTWVKDSLVMGRCDYHYRHESIFYGWTKGTHRWFGGRNKNSVLEFPRPRVSRLHPTMKPPELVAECLRNSAKRNHIILDPFGGSGSTLIAAAGLKMKARIIELDPRYCDVIRRRWTRYAVENDLKPGDGALHGER